MAVAEVDFAYSAIKKITCYQRSTKQVWFSFHSLKSSCFSDWSFFVLGLSWRLSKSLKMSDQRRKGLKTMLQLTSQLLWVCKTVVLYHVSKYYQYYHYYIGLWRWLQVTIYANCGLSVGESTSWCVSYKCISLYDISLHVFDFWHVTWHKSARFRDRK